MILKNGDILNSIYLNFLKKISAAIEKADELCYNLIDKRRGQL